MRVRLRAVAVAAAVLTATAACAGADPEASPAEEPVAAPAEGDTSPQDPTDEPDGPAEGSEDDGDSQVAPVRGTVTVDGTRYEITELRNCDPYEMDMIDVELELQGIGEHDGERVQIDVYVQTIAGTQADDVSWAGPEGVFGGPEDANVTLDADGTSVRGVATLLDALTQTETVDIEFDLDVPAGTIACR